MVCPDNYISDTLLKSMIGPALSLEYFDFVNSKSIGVYKPLIIGLIGYDLNYNSIRRPPPKIAILKADWPASLSIHLPASPMSQYSYPSRAILGYLSGIPSTIDPEEYLLEGIKERLYCFGASGTVLYVRGSVCYCS
jgi:hypothetical protein